MNNRLLWQLFCIIAVGTVLLFWLISIVTQKTEQHMSHIAPQHQQQLLAYACEAERLYLEGDEVALEDWLQTVQAEEGSWAAVARTDARPLTGRFPLQQYVGGFWLGRSIEWKIHLYFKDNPVMDIPFTDENTHFLIKLPQRMRPGKLFSVTELMLQVALPFVLLCAVSLVLYRHLMSPLKKLELAARQFSDGRFDVRVKNDLGSRNDELAALADTFDQMAERISTLIIEQRQLLGDLSHEMRTPLARIDMAVECVSEGVNPQQALERLRYESGRMRELVEDTLTLGWLNNEKPVLNKESFDLVELVLAVCEDACFEYPEHNLITELPAQAPLHCSSQRALGQALENIIRNALSYTAVQGRVLVLLRVLEGKVIMTVRDQGPGVPEHLLEDIFKPFFQVERSRVVRSVSASSRQRDRAGGFGLGLALARRQVEAVGGFVCAQNYRQSGSETVAGLQVTIELPA